jgi:hypothetical protein
MPTYRIYYAERQPTEDDRAAFQSGRLGGLGISRQDAYAETEWEEEIDAASEVEALDAFFREHAPDRSRLGVLDVDGNSAEFEGWDFDPEATYIWTEQDKMMEYQGIDEATPGMVTCPLCNGHGEVDQETAIEFDEVWNEEDDTARGDVSG